MGSTPVRVEWRFASTLLGVQFVMTSFRQQKLKLCANSWEDSTEMVRLYMKPFITIHSAKLWFDVCSSRAATVLQWSPN